MEKETTESILPGVTGGAFIRKPTNAGEAEGRGQTVNGEAGRSVKTNNVNVEAVRNGNTITVYGESEFAPATVVSSAANFIMNAAEPFVHTYRTYLKLRENGPLTLKCWHSNSVDSTWDKGQDSRAGQPGGEWLIEEAYIADGGTEPDGTVMPGSQVKLTFGGQVQKEVHPGERFWSDEADIMLADGHYLAFTWTIRTGRPGPSVPFNVEGMLVPGYDGEGRLAGHEGAEGLTKSDRLLVMPGYIGYRKKPKRRLVFLGDSITQGVRTAQDGYTYWAARIAEGLGPDYALWNLGSGWGRAYDVAAGGSWLHKTQQGDEVLIVLGVNDLDIGERTAEELLLDLRAIIAAIKAANPAAAVILGTVPPFNFTGERERYWRQVNEAILNAAPEGTDRVFDIAAVLSMPGADNHRIKPEYMSSADDPHPNGEAGRAVAEAFLEWYLAG